ncbi:xanthan lyase [Parabacteroides sp. 52]|uniref:golvesin C-terminal-like domain-containing protein n=1 Tax=unclassified Parabacteroides TaxID=2649774 RepID=UPI0013D0B544|nr:MULTISPECIES: xanthan lyase [unclassified Parabacteroides]MDH6535260.1 ABC-type transport system involved in multi-copper enzyme maturation permease subunit [Parabacteroides sp. PM5-20]NDV55823.1 xanthan lyase [Parabacteroides sp. 52]
MSFINNIQSVSKYESKLLIRSWFFKVFSLLAIVILTFFNWMMLMSEDGGGFWAAKAIPSNIPYINLLLLNTGQAIIAIFLASDFLKRDKKLDTSEVFYVRPLSNAEYVIGKIWGNLRVFLLLNLIIMAISLLFTFMASGITVDWSAYLIYFFLISIPTLVYIIGLSIFLMLILKNQALTFILLLGYIGLTLFYISDKYYYLFDYMAYYLPMLKSTIIGFTNLEAILTHRAIYFFAGIAFIGITISLFRRLPNASRNNYPWLIFAVCMLTISGLAGYRHIHSIVEKEKMRTMYTQINNTYVHTPKMVIDQYDLSIEQQPASLHATATMKGIALETASVFTFCLNPGLDIEEIKSGDKTLSFERDQQIFRVAFGRQLIKGDTASLSVRYTGHINNAFCYLDIPAEIIQKEYRSALFNADKAYSFLTPEYMLLTPETYWYPRPGTAYSNESPDWQQSYFSRFHLQVTPLPGLQPLSQGEAVKNEDGSYIFHPEYPAQAITLIAGKYKQQRIEKDNIAYSVWHIEGNDFYTSSFDSIRDTIPTLVTHLKENLERTYKLTYPFNRFSVVEVPAQFYSYPHAWSQAQEVIQPEMVLFTEKAWRYDQFDVKRQIKNQKKWAKWRGQEINDEEAAILTFNGMIRLFERIEGNYNYTSANRGEYNLTTQANPYFLFPLLYNFRYNIYSPEWPISNRIVELYLQNKEDDNNWQREVNGISNNEKANLLLEKQTFKELLADVSQRDLLNNIVGIKANALFAPAEIQLGVNRFRDSVYSLLERNTFRNIQLENLLDTLGQISQTDIRSTLPEWEKPTPLPYYIISQPEVTKVSHRGQETFVMKIQVANDSDYDGIIHLHIQEGNRQDMQTIDPRTNRKIALGAHQSKEFVSLWENAPREVTINTMTSKNLPNRMVLPIGNNKQDRRSITEKEGDYVIPKLQEGLWGEIIVDNEDSLFFLSETAIMGLLPQWLEKTEDTSFKYAGIHWWRPPLQWTATTNAGYYGKYVRSAYVIKSGSGKQTATWKIPVPTEGSYELYYYVYKGNEMRQNNRSDAEYHFRIRYNEETEDAYLNLRRANDGWEQIGVYYVSDTISVTLTDACKLRSVSADAVKVVKR